MSSNLGCFLFLFNTIILDRENFNISVSAVPICKDDNTLALGQLQLSQIQNVAPTDDGVVVMYSSHPMI